MFNKGIRFVLGLFMTLLGVAAATPALPAPALAEQAVQDALAIKPAVTVAPLAAQNRAAAIEKATQTEVAAAKATGRSVVARATAYNSLPNQTDSTPFITATGTRTRPGVVALSRDLLRVFPYGTRVTIEDLSGRYNSALKGRVFIVEDTMAARKVGSIDIWMTTRSQALQFGARQVRITAVR